MRFEGMELGREWREKCPPMPYFAELVFEYEKERAMHRRPKRPMERPVEVVGAAA